MRIVDGNERVAIAERAYSFYLTEGQKRGLDLPSSDVFLGAVQQALIDYNTCCEEYEKSTCVEPPVGSRIPDPDNFRVESLEKRVEVLESSVRGLEGKARFG
jgi:hypothetical protein